jgi:hypothetical protein
MWREPGKALLQCPDLEFSLRPAVEIEAIFQPAVGIPNVPIARLGVLAAIFHHGELAILRFEH